MVDCVFCKIIAGQIPSTIVHSDEKVFSFLDINPANKGHTLVVPRTHYPTFNDIPPSEIQHLFETAQTISKAMEKGLHADGYNLMCNNKRPAGQEVDHVHIHIIPRFNGDHVSVKLGWEYKKYDKGEEKTVADKIRKHL